jgi:hypothetical protein
VHSITVPKVREMQARFAGNPSGRLPPTDQDLFFLLRREDGRVTGSDPTNRPIQGNIFDVSCASKKVSCEQDGLSGWRLS